MSVEAATPFGVAMQALGLGLSPLPPCEDGTKRPLADIKRATFSTWAPYQRKPATEEHVREWYRNGRSGVGLVGGYGDLDPFEFDCRDTYDAYVEAAIEAGLGELINRIRRGYEEFTPGGGVHWLFRCPDVRGSTKLAQRPAPTEKDPNAKKTLIETKGKGGFIIIAPTNGKVHPSGGVYRLVCGGLDQMAAITPEEREELWNLARTFDEIPEESKPEPDSSTTWTQTATKGGDFPKVGTKVGDDFAARTSWEAILEPHNWVKAFTRGEVIYWRRPDKDKGWSATTGKWKGLKVFSTSTSFGTAGTYTKLRTYAVLNHRDDIGAAVKELAAKGFGTWIDDDGKEHQNPVSKEWFESRKKAQGARNAVGGAISMPLLDSEWDALTDDELGIISAEKVDPEPVDWLWPERIAKKKMNILAGEGKKGKTQLALAIAAAVSTGGELPGGGGRVEAGTVIILSAEDDPEDILAPRLIALGADMTKIKLLKSEYTIRRKDRAPEINPVTFQDTIYWRAVFRRFPDVKLFIADPLPSFLGRGVNDHKNAEIRSALTPFLGIVRQFKIAMLAVTHLTKGFDPKRPASHRINGSIAYSNLARSIHFVAKDPDNPERRLFMMAENTSARSDLPAVAFTLEPRDVTNKRGEVFQIWVPKFETATVDVDVDQVVNSDVQSKKRSGPEPDTIKPLAGWIVDYLASEKRPVRRGDLYNAAGAAGFLGEYGPQKDGKLRWGKGWKLPRAIELVPHLDGSRGGFQADEMTDQGVTYYTLATLAKPQETES
jgi:hypothetical protein